MPKHHYGLKEIKRSVRDLLIGKGFTAFSSIATALLVARELEVKEYAAYVTLAAVIVIVQLVTKVGLQQAVFRYLPELRNANYGRPMYHLMMRAFISRIVTVSLALLVIVYFLKELADALSITVDPSLIKLYLVLGFVHIIVNFIVSTFECLLWQRISRISLVAGGMVRLISIIAVINIASLNLAKVITIELIGELITLSVLIIGLIHKWKNDEQGHMDQ